MDNGRNKLISNKLYSIHAAKPKSGAKDKLIEITKIF
jgi:hypothetical protein